MRIKLALSALVLSLFVLGCQALGWTSQDSRAANAVLNGVACGVAAANGTPCTPEAVLEALAKDADAQREKVEALVPQAAAVDPALTEQLLAELKANRASSEAVTKALLVLATRMPPAPAPDAAPLADPVDAGAPDASP